MFVDYGYANEKNSRLNFWPIILYEFQLYMHLHCNIVRATRHRFANSSPKTIASRLAIT